MPEVEGTHRVSTCAVLLLTLTSTLTFDLSSPKPHHLYTISPRSFHIPSLKSLGSFVFELRCGKRKRQTDKQADVAEHLTHTDRQVIESCRTAAHDSNSYNYINWDKVINIVNIRVNNKKDGYRQPNVRQFLYILASPGYAPGTIAVNVKPTWMKREFNACQTHRSMYPSIFNRFPVI